MLRYLEVPQLRRPVFAGGGEQPSVRAERHPQDRAGVAGEDALVLALIPMSIVAIKRGSPP